MQDSNSPPPSYTTEPGLGECTLDEKTLTDLTITNPETKEKKLPENILQPLNLPYSYENNDLAYSTPLTTPYTTAYNTPLPYPYAGFQDGSAQTNSAPAPAFHFPHPYQQSMFTQAYMGGPNGIPMQPVCVPKEYAAPPINVVVNSTATTSGTGDSERRCPKCRVGIIVRKQHRARQVCILALGILTACCLCASPCLLLRNNYVDKCSYCGMNYGHRGAKVEKIKKPKK